MANNLSSGHADDVPTEITKVLSKLSETLKIIASGYEKRTPEQYNLLGEKIQSFNDGTDEFSQKNFSVDSHYQHRTEMKKFLKKIGMDQYIPIMESSQLPPTDAELPFAQFFFTRDLKVLKPLFRKFCSSYWEWDLNWDNLLKSNDEQRPNTPYWGWHSGLAEAPAQYRDIILHSKTAVDFAALDQVFMDPAEVIQLMLYLAKMKKKSLDKNNWTICPRSRWSFDYVPRFDSSDGMSYVDCGLPDGSSDGCRVRVLSIPQFPN